MDNMEENNGLLISENSFKRLSKKPLILLEAKNDIEEILKLIFLWFPNKVALLKENEKTLILVSGLNTYQIMQLFAKEVSIYYLNDNKNFIPWDYFYYKKEIPFTLLDISGKKRLITIDKFTDYTEHINVNIDKVRLKEDGLLEEIDLEIALIEGEYKEPEFLLFHLEYYNELIKILRLNVPKGNNDKLKEIDLSFEYIKIGNERFILIKRGDISKKNKIIDILASKSFCNYYNYHKKNIFVENGKKITPDIPERMIIRNFDYTSMYFLSSLKNITTVFTLNDQNLNFLPINKLGDLTTKIHLKRIMDFANLK